MTGAERQRIEARLSERLAELVRSRLAMATANDGMIQSELSHMDNHPAEADLHELELDATTRMLLEEEERRIEEARRALAAGTYGRCRVCGQTIPPARLEAMPEAVRCLDCQRHFEGDHRARTLH